HAHQRVSHNGMGHSSCGEAAPRPEPRPGISGYEVAPGHLGASPCMADHPRAGVRDPLRLGGHTLNAPRRTLAGKPAAETCRTRGERMTAVMGRRASGSYSRIAEGYEGSTPPVLRR